MATFLDTGLFSHFGTIFVVLIVFLVLFGLLEYIKAFGEGRRGLHALIAMAVAFLFLASKVASYMVGMMVPWFMIFIIFIFFVILMIRMFGRTEADMRNLIADANVYPWIVVFAILILLLALGNAFGQGLLEKGEGNQPINYSEGSGYGSEPATSGTPSTTTTSFSTNLLNTLRHPKVLGVLFVLLVGAFTLLFLTRAQKT